MRQSNQLLKLADERARAGQALEGAVRPHEQTCHQLERAQGHPLSRQKRCTQTPATFPGTHPLAPTHLQRRAGEQQAVAHVQASQRLEQPRLRGGGYKSRCTLVACTERRWEVRRSHDCNPCQLEMRQKHEHTKAGQGMHSRPSKPSGNSRLASLFLSRCPSSTTSTSHSCKEREKD